MQKAALLFATFFGIGKLKPAPGTWATAATIPLWLVLSQLSSIPYLSLTLVLIFIAIFSASVYEQVHGGHDHSEIVIDEVVGFLITMALMPTTWQAILFGFLLFRVLDIAKPFPIGYLDKKVGGGLGVIIDDVVAGAIANIILQLVLLNTNWLGTQLIMIQK